MAVPLSCEATTKEEATGLAAHLHLIIQLSRDLGSQWQKMTGISGNGQQQNLCGNGGSKFPNIWPMPGCPAEAANLLHG